jgi:hypothetical protein
MSTTPTPDAVLRALWDTDFDLPAAAATLHIPLASFVLLLQQPAYAGPLAAMHDAAKTCLDLKAAKAVGMIVDTLRHDLEACDDQPESRRIATALTKTINAATRLTKGATTRGAPPRVGPDVTLPAAGGAGVPPAAAPAIVVPPAAPTHPLPTRNILAPAVSRATIKAASAGQAAAA